MTTIADVSYLVLKKKINKKSQENNSVIKHKSARFLLININLFMILTDSFE